jgi:glycosyltransferase involved in cell wall biosynthesis
MIRVMIVLEAAAGGTLRHLIETALGCRRRGAQVLVVCSGRNHPAAVPALQALHDAGIEVEELSMRHEVDLIHDAVAALQLRRLIQRTAPDVLHLHSSKAGAIGRIAVMGMGSRAPEVVYTPHAYAFGTQPGKFRRWAYRWIERTLLRWTNRIVAVSASEGQAARSLGAPERVRVCSNGVDAATHLLAQDAEPPADGPLRIGWLGRMVWQKQPEAAIIVSFVLTRLGVKHRLKMGGDGPARYKVIQAIRHFEVGASVDLLGDVSEPDSFHGGIDLLLITSRYEGLPYAALDAMAYGLPIVGFDAPGVRDLVVHGETGLLAQPDDAGALAAEIMRLARDGECRRAFGAAARRRVMAEYRLDHQIDQLFDLYRSAAKSRVRPLLGATGHVSVRPS